MVRLKLCHIGIYVCIWITLTPLALTPRSVVSDCILVSWKHARLARVAVFLLLGNGEGGAGK